MHAAFIAVVGPSGAGKDSLLGIARARLSGDGRFVFARRVVTRSADPASEDHDFLDESAFEAAAAGGDFCVTWRAHGLSYGLPSALADDYRNGRAVIANVSRRSLEAIASRFANLHVIEVTASPAVLMQRLLARGREPAAQIEARLSRAVEIPEGEWTLHRLDNSGELDVAAERCVDVIRAIVSQDGA